MKYRLRRNSCFPFSHITLSIIYAHPEILAIGLELKLENKHFLRATCQWQMNPPHRVMTMRCDMDVLIYTSARLGLSVSIAAALHLKPRPEPPMGIFWHH